MRAITIITKSLAIFAITLNTIAPALADGDHKHGNSPKSHGRHDNGLHLGWGKNGKLERLGSSYVVAGDPYRSQAQRRQQKKNEWRNIAYASGAVAIIGLLSKDSTLTFAGTAGALYSAYRYEQDRKSQNKLNRARAAYFSKSYFYRDGHRYDRRTVVKNGKTYYQFVRHG